MKRGLVLVALVAAMLAVPSVSQARSQAYYWTPKTAAQSLVDSGIQWRDGFHTVNYALCQGYGGYINRGGTTYYHTFGCYIEPGETDPYYVRLIVAGQTSFRVQFLKWA